MQGIGSTSGGDVMRMTAVLAAVCALGGVTCASEAPIPTLHCVGYAHLDTQWRWDYRQTIGQFLPDTLTGNFALLERYPELVFNFTGARRYRMAEEYYPELHKRLLTYVRQGRWAPVGSSVDEFDTLVPCPESMVRQILYGNRYFRMHYGQEPVDVMLPDCFGFAASLPAVMAHCGLKGFSTQKLTWNSAVGIPFSVGMWRGPDGSEVMAALDPGSYVGSISGRVDSSSDWSRRIHTNTERFGLPTEYHYFGVGDTGGPLREDDVRRYAQASRRTDGEYRVNITRADQLFRDTADAQRARLPRYTGEMLLIEHSAGSLSSQAWMKRSNRKNEVMADCAERAAVMAWWLGEPYPVEALREAWWLVLGSQMHDMLPGTSLPRCYDWCWSDELLAARRFQTVLDHSIQTVAARLDTQGQGLPIIVFNPSVFARDDVTEVRLPNAKWRRPAVLTPDGRIVAAQYGSWSGSGATVLFRARVPATSVNVFRLIEMPVPVTATALRVSTRSLQNERYRVRIDDNGDISSIVDLSCGGKELLQRPARLVFQHEAPSMYPAWNMDWKDRQKPPIDWVRGPAKIRVIERGPVRVAIEVTRRARNSVFVQRISLSKGSDRVQVDTEIDWQSRGVSLKAEWPLTVSNPTAIWGGGVGVVRRGTNNSKCFEMPVQRWMNLADTTGAYGVSLYDDGKFGSDKPADNTMRLTLLYTPEARGDLRDQNTQDWGRHHLTYGLAGHSGPFRPARISRDAECINMPLLSWVTTAHSGLAGRSLSLLRIDEPAAGVLALKREEDRERLVVRLTNRTGAPATARIDIAAKVMQARPIDGQERPIAGRQPVDLQGLKVALPAWGIRSVSVQISRKRQLRMMNSLKLPYDTDVTSADGERIDHGIGNPALRYPAELWPRQLKADGVPYSMAPGTGNAPNAVRMRGQTLALPGTGTRRLHLLVSAEQTRSVTFRVDSQRMTREIGSWTGLFGAFDRRVKREPGTGRCIAYTGGAPAGIQPAWFRNHRVAWWSSHVHDRNGANAIYQYGYLHQITLDLTPRDRYLVLPRDGSLFLFAAVCERNPTPTLQYAGPDWRSMERLRTVSLRGVNPSTLWMGISPLGRVIQRRATDIGALLPDDVVRTDDVADVHRGIGANAYAVSGDGLAEPHSNAGADGKRLPRLLDGLDARNHDDIGRAVWLDGGEGRILLDLNRLCSIDRIVTHSWHRTNRAPQRFTLWMQSSEKTPITTGNPDEHGWQLLARVNTEDLGDGGVHTSHVAPVDNTPWRVRWLLWVIDEADEGPFLTELDVWGDAL